MCSMVEINSKELHQGLHIIMCFVDRCLELGCGSVAVVTSLLLRKLLPSSVATFKAPTLQMFNWFRV